MQDEDCFLNQTHGTMPEIRQSFKSYQPPGGLTESMEKLLSILRADETSAIDAIVLTDAESIGKGRTKRVRGRKYAQRDCLGFYHPAGRYNTAWIQIVVDNVFAGVPRFAQARPLVREILLGHTLYHEVGHHLQRTHHEAGGEIPAERWAKRLSRRFVEEHYRWLLLLARPVVRMYRLARRVGRGVRRLAPRFDGRARER